MGKSNQLPKTEGCLAEGKEPKNLRFNGAERPSRGVPREKREPQARPATGLSDSASRDLNASGDGVISPEPKMEATATGEVAESLPESKSVARVEGDTRNRRDPESSRRTNCEGQAGKRTQRQEAFSDAPGVGSAHSIRPQGESPQAGEGADMLTKSAQATRAVRMTEQDWQTFLRAIAEKAGKDKHHRFGDLFRRLNQDVPRLCFWRLRKDAASGVDGVTFERVVAPKQRGRGRMIRYADDFAACFGYRHEAEAFEKALKERLAKFGLEVAADKTKTLRFGHNGGPHNGRFDFLGFEFYWEPDRQGKPRVKRRTATKKWRAGRQRMKEWIKTHRHWKLARLKKSLSAKLQGTWNYYGRIGNTRRMKLFYDETCRALHKWLNRRSQRKSMRWGAFNRMLQRYHVPRPRLVEKNQRMPCQKELSFCQRLMDVLKPGAVLKTNARAS